MPGLPIQDVSDLLNLATGAGSPEVINFWKDARVAGVAAPSTISGRLHDLFLYDGMPGTAVAPTTAVVPTNATQGCIGQTDPASGYKKWLHSIGGVGSAAGTLVLYDLLSHQGGLSGTSAPAAQTTNLPTAALTRYTSGLGVEIWLKIYTQIGASATTVTASYTNTTPTAGRTTTAVAIGAANNREMTRVIALPLQAGDRGVTSVGSVTLAATTGTAGNFGVSLVKRIAEIPFPLAGVCGFANLVRGGEGPIEIAPGAALFLAWHANATVAPQILPGSWASFVEK